MNERGRANAAPLIPSRRDTAGIRASFDAIPDAPISKVVINMQGGRKGLIVNSTSLCAARRRAAVRLEAHNGRRQAKGVVVRASGCRNR